MKIFADASFLYNVYYPAQTFSALARRFWDRAGLRITASVAVVLEFRIGALWDTQNETGWNEFKQDRESGKVKEVAVDWDKLFSEFEPSALQYGLSAQPRLIDGLHVLAARQIGATHFLSFDHRSRQRAFARAMGLKVLPEKLPGEF
jgi:predicted nucleic acid-binding protein